MKYCKWFYLLTALALPAGAAEIPAPAAQVMVFRNNNALIRYKADPKGAAVFTVTGNFSPLEGTLWFSSNVKQIRKVIAEVSRKEAVPFRDITATYKNQRVTLRVNAGDGKIEKISGTVLDFGKQNGEDPGNGIVILKCAAGKILALQRHQITGVESVSLKAAERTVKEEKQAWEFTMQPKAAGKVTFDCISRTLGWTPALKMVLHPENKFTLYRSATVVNNGDELKNVKCILWAGTPNIEKAGLISPMAIVKYLPRPPQPRSKGVYMASFRSRRNAAAAGDMTVPEAVSYMPSAPGLSGNMAPFDIGLLSLKKGEALVRTLGNASGSYENLVRWNIPARQGDNGTRVWKNNVSYNGELWECLRFVNPFTTAVPDAPAEICDGERVLAQIGSSWINPGEKAVWEIARCRDVKATFTEQEAGSSVKNRGVGLFQKIDQGKSLRSVKGGEKNISVKGGYINGYWYRVTDIKGQISVKNFRKTPVKLVIAMEYFGVFVSASGKPAQVPVNHFGSLNPKNKLVWQLTLKPGETRKLDFRYNIIINR